MVLQFIRERTDFSIIDAGTAGYSFRSKNGLLLQPYTKSNSSGIKSLIVESKIIKILTFMVLRQERIFIDHKIQKNTNHKEWNSTSLKLRTSATRKLTGPLMNLIKLQDIKLIYRNLLHLYILTTHINRTRSEISEREIKQIIPFTIASKRIKYLGIST